MWQTKRHRGTGRSLCFSLCILLWFIEGRLCWGSDKLSGDDSLSGSDTIISEKGTFEMGFFSKKTGTYDNLYLGIWYKDFEEKTIVWIANRKTPLPNMPSSRLEISGNGIVLFDEVDIAWSSGMSSIYPDSVEAVLLDSGNLVVRDVSKPSVIFWQSFDHPTDTWLPEAKLGFHKVNNKRQRLTSWKNADDPSSGMFSVGVSLDETGEYSLKWNMSDKYWGSGPFVGKRFGSVPELSYRTNFSLVSNENETYYTYTIVDPLVLTMFRITPSGKFQQLESFKSPSKWTETFVQPKNKSDIFASCGAYGIFSENSSKTCSCLKGFSPISAEATHRNDWFGGCKRQNRLQCENSTSGKGKIDGYLNISTIKLPANSKVYHAQNDKQCKSACTQNCTCTAYAFNASGCFIWEGDLYDVRQLSNDDYTKQDLYLKVSNSDLPDTPGKRKTLEVVVAVLVPLVVLFSGGFIGCFYTRKIKQKGLFSIKSDVFSFGVLVLEIVSGKKNTGFYRKDSLNLLGHTWELWTSNRGVKLLDPALGSPKPSLLRYINLGLLCVQENPNDRPTMSTVISMLTNEVAPLPAPKQPAFAFSRSLMNTASPSNSTGGSYSVNGLTVSMVEPR
ncbi:unnamed protein product [Fraxinus pennsylvanica]|uniref:Uncharacterized protein n=1 Tax=Fraxinus pennsylvanica TaxID=56036 RepID=A0AAD1YZK7_9LAMI|nr:unnamed protein product [Fraxinus pennsylvanica]